MSSWRTHHFAWKGKKWKLKWRMVDTPTLTLLLGENELAAAMEFKDKPNPT